MKSFDNTWEEIHSTQEWGKYPSEPVIRFVARNYYKISDRKSVKILDFGCGGGAHTWYLAREGFDTYAFDGSKSAIEKVRRFLDKEGLSADLRVYDAAEITYDNDFFDAVIDSACVYANKLEYIKVMYQKIYNILKKDGKLFSTAFSTRTTGYGTGEKLEHNTYKDLTEGNLEGRGIVHFWEGNELKEILENVGFKNVEIEPMEYVDKGNVVSLLVAKAQK